MKQSGGAMKWGAFEHTREECDDASLFDQTKAMPSFFQLRPYYEGSERLMRVFYCPHCAGYEEVEFYGGEGQQ